MSLEGAVNDYTSGALEAYDRDDVAGLLKNHLDEARRDLEDARDRVKAVCELVEKPHDAPAYFKAFLGQENEGLRLKFYQFVSGLIRSYGTSPANFPRRVTPTLRFGTSSGKWTTTPRPATR